MSDLKKPKLAVDIIKRGGKRPTEAFTYEKLRQSLISACLSVRSPRGQAEQTADKVCDAVMVWLEKRPEVTSADIRRIATQNLKTYHPDAAYIYESYRHTI